MSGEVTSVGHTDREPGQTGRRERILAALRGEVPDRPPVAFDAHPDPLARLLHHYGAADKNDLYRVAGIDGFSVWEWNAVMGRYAGQPRNAPDGTPLDFWGTNYNKHIFGLGACDTPEQIAAHQWPRAADFDFSHVRAQALEIKAKDMAVAAGHMALGFQVLHLHRGMERGLEDMADREWMGRCVERMTESTLGYMDALLTAGRGEIDVVRADDDIGTMERFLISPRMWREYFKPGWKAGVELAHRHGAKVWFHSCGYIWPLLEDLIEIGVDCWNPFPSYVKDNDHARLREMRRGRLALDGGVNHFTLVSGTPAQVADETRRVLDTFAPDGGLLIGPSQVLTEDMPTENMVAMFETAVKG